MAKFDIGDLVVLKSGSMRMLVEDVHEDGTVSTVWCNEGAIGRDRFAEPLLNKWEHREDDRARGGDRPSGKPRGGEDRGPHTRGRFVEERGERSGQKARDRDEGRGGDRPRPKTGWDGKPREKKYFRKED